METDPYYIKLRDALSSNIARMTKARKTMERFAADEVDELQVIDIQLQVMQMQLDAVEKAIEDGLEWNVPDSVKEMVISAIDQSNDELNNSLDEIEAEEKMYDEGFCYQLIVQKREEMSADDAFKFFENFPHLDEHKDSKSLAKQLSRELYSSGKSTLSSNDPKEIEDFINYVRANDKIVRGMCMHSLDSDVRMEKDPIPQPFYGTPNQALTILIQNAREDFTHDELCDLIEEEFDYLTPAQGMELATKIHKTSHAFIATGKRSLMEKVAIRLYKKGLDVCLMQTSKNTKDCDDAGIWQTKQYAGGFVIADNLVPVQEPKD